MIEKIWFEKHFKKDLILKIKNLTNKKRYDSNIKPFSTEKATYLKCWIKSLIGSKYLWKKKEIKFERDLIEKIWFEKDLILKNFENLKKKLHWKTESSLLCHPGVKRPEWCTFWRLTPKILPFWALNAQPGTLAGV